MIQQGVLTLVIPLFVLGAVSVYSAFQHGGSSFLEIEGAAMTICTGTVANERDLAIDNNPTRISQVLPKSVTDDQSEATSIWLEVVPEQMKFDQDTFTVKAGKKIILELDNLDGMQHNLLILQPNSFEKVGAAADAMLRDPKASEKHYVPEMPEVLFATEMLDPNEVYTLKFTAPNTPGNYPFVCTFPGHWRMMRGIMVVEKS